MKHVLGEHLMDLGSYRRAKLVKLHGSVNWVVPISPDPADPMFPSGRERQDQIDYDARLAVAIGNMFNRGPVKNLDPVAVIPPDHRALRPAGGGPVDPRSPACFIGCTINTSIHS